MAEVPVETLEQANSPERRAKERFDNYMGLMWHVGTYVIINAFLWILDLIQGGGIDWAYWVTVMWGIGLAFHIVAYRIGDDDSNNPRYKRYLEEERQRNPFN